jgi:hypothetical protein
MKNLLVLTSLVLLTSFYPKNENEILSPRLRVDIINNSATFKPTNITFDKIDKSIKGKQFKESAELFFFLNKRKMSAVDYSLILGHFITPDNSLGIICCDKIYECDHPTDTYSLYIVDKDGNLSDQLIIKYRSDGITLYEIGFEFEDDSTIQISEKTSSEYAIEPDSKTDTIKTTKYKINFLKTPFDTIEKKQFQKIINF